MGLDLLLMKSKIEKYLLKHLQKAVIANKYSYSTFGKVAEPLVARGVKDYFIEKHGYLESDFFEAPHKNAFPDLKFNNIAIEFKCAVSNEAPENDMGTLNSWPKKIEQYEDNIYYVFVAYTETNSQVKIEHVFFDKFYKFVGRNSDGLLKYREKDGNLRPKSWNDFYKNKSYFNTLGDFKKVLKKTDSYRSARIVNKHIKKMSKPDLEALYSKLHKNLNK